MRKKIILGLLAVCMCSLVGCDDSERMDGAMDQAIERQEDARDAVDEYNEDVQELEDTADEIEEE